MGLKTTWKKWFGSHAETSDTPQDPMLKTCYFKVNRDTAYQTMIELFNEQDFEIVAQSKEHGEISVNYKGKRKVFLVASVIMVRPFHTAVDFTVTVESSFPFDFGYRYQVVHNLYDQLKKKLPYIKNAE
ncbi:MAG: cytosolic protein [Bacillaceae bacterium]|nr:cytosolic protein [Bacillaceae bacterium]